MIRNNRTFRLFLVLTSEQIGREITRHFQIVFVNITFLMWEKPYISIFVEIGALRNFMHSGGHLKNGYRNDRRFEIALVMITFL